MNRLLFTILIVFQSFISIGQNSGKAQSDSFSLGENPNCLYKLTYNSTERLRIFPFSSAHEVWIVSFPYSFDKDIPLLSFDRLSNDHSIFREAKKLTAGAIDSLTDILYNLNYSDKKDSVDGYPIIYQQGEKDCYMPQNAILFIDTHGKTFGYIELCFECDRYKSSSEAIQTGNFCWQKYGQLKLYFTLRGIKYGTTDPIWCKCSAPAGHL
ncbi:hypothetical protein [Phnomibacter sp. MR]|uniref:hypothetical protein n=1 Tax=Phnomibacter sp. MR TaxID=3042318 RepID=UPI003A804EEB